MERLFTKVLKEWFLKETKKPLMVFGARQVGKSYIINEFCEKCGMEYHKFDLIENPEIKNFFTNKVNIKEAITTFALATNINLDSNNTIIFFDEIQESEEIISALKYFNINYPNITIVTAGSLLGVALKKLEKSFPVGYVEEKVMYPLNFQEFLINTKNERFIPKIEQAFNNNEPLDDNIHELLLNLYNKFLILGGMPRIVQNYLDNGQELGKVDFNILEDIITEYSRDAAKYSDNEKEKLRINRIYNHIVSQLSKENPKFTYAKIDKRDNRKADYITALYWLMSSNTILKCNQVTAPKVPLTGYENEDSYKIYMSDVGLLAHKSGINRGVMLLDGDYPFKGRITENYIACELISNKVDLLYYTKKSENNNGMEIDFIMETKDGVIPIEVKAVTHTQSKSLQVFMREVKPKYGIRLSRKNFGFANNIKSVPLYATFMITKDI